jgi:hypothetical protein
MSELGVGVELGVWYGRFLGVLFAPFLVVFCRPLLATAILQLS